MPANQRKTATNKFPLRLMPSVRKAAEQLSTQEGVSLNQFINLAVAEKVALMQHQEWLAARPKPSAARTAQVLAFLDEPTGNPPEASDELPEGYVSIRNSPEYTKALRGNS
jgi:hypothetical protein